MKIEVGKKKNEVLEANKELVSNPEKSFYGFISFSTVFIWTTFPSSQLGAKDWWW